MTEPPGAAIRRARSSRALVWLFPLGAAVAAAFGARDLLGSRGPLVTLSFPDAAGIRNDDTPVLHRGISIGKVVGVELSEDQRRALVQVRLKRARADFAREGAAFWIVSPVVTEAGIGGLNTLFSGPYIEARPGTGAPIDSLAGLLRPPSEEGLRLALAAKRLKSLRPGAPVSYRGVQVGVIDDARLSANAQRVELAVVVWRRYAPLVTTRSRFWTVSPLDVKGGLFSGVEFKLESLRELVTGEIAFATPEKDAGAPASDGARFVLEEQPRKEWLEWAPRAAIAPSGLAEGAVETRFPTGRDLMEAKLK